MMPVLHPRASACAKIILFGEHAVVHGQPALAAALPDALRLEAERLDDPRAPLTLDIPAWSLSLQLVPELEHPVARACADVLAHCDGPLQGWAIRGDASIPAGAGLGSSAALTVALAKLALGPDAAVEEIVEASMVGEQVFHGTPSGIDSQVAARGGVLRFVRGAAPVQVALPRPVTLLVVPSGHARSTAAEVAKVHLALERWPTLARPMIEVLGRTTELGERALLEGDVARLGQLADIAHGVLAGLGVSSPILDELCGVARAAGAAGAKLTGAGGGGCMLAWPAGDPTALVAAFEARGLSPLVVEVGR